MILNLAHVSIRFIVSRCGVDPRFSGVGPKQAVEAVRVDRERTRVEIATLGQVDLERLQLRCRRPWSVWIAGRRYRSACILKRQRTVRRS